MKSKTRHGTIFRVLLTSRRDVERAEKWRLI